MSHLDSLPWWVALPAAAFLMIGSTLALLGCIGLVRLKSFYDRIHAPTLATSWGTAAIMISSMLIFSWIGGRLVVHEFVIAAFIMITTPITLMLLGRAALYRDRLENSPLLPKHMQIKAQQENLEDNAEALSDEELASDPQAAKAGS